MFNKIKYSTANQMHTEKIYLWNLECFFIQQVYFISLFSSAFILNYYCELKVSIKEN